MRSRRGSRLLSLISTIAILGVAVAVSALIVIIGVMDGLQTDLREKILIGSPDIRVMTYGEDLVMNDWQAVLAKVQRQPGVVAAGPFVHTQALVRAGHHKYLEGVFVEGLPPDGPGVPQVTTIRQRATAGNFKFETLDGQAPRRRPRVEAGGEAQCHAGHRLDHAAEHRPEQDRPGHRLSDRRNRCSSR